MLLKKGVHILTKKMNVCTINREEDCREVHGQIPTWCKSTLLCCVQQQTVWTANTRIGAFLFSELYLSYFQSSMPGVNHQHEE